MSPSAVKMPTRESPAMPMALRQDRTNTSMPSSRMSLVRWKPISNSPRPSVRADAPSPAGAGTGLSQASFCSSVGIIARLRSVSLQRGGLQQAEAVPVDGVAHAGRNHHRGERRLDDDRPVDLVAGPQRVRVVDGGLGPPLARPPGRPLAGQGRPGVRGLHGEVRQGRLRGRHGDLQHEVVQVYAAGLVDDQRAEGLGELSLELVVQRLDILRAAQVQHRAGGALHVDLPAVEHVQLEAEHGPVRGQALGRQIGSGLLDQLVDDRVEHPVLGGQLLGHRRHHDHPAGGLVDVDDVHDRRAQRAEHRRGREDHGPGQVAEEAGHVGRPGPAEREQREVLRVVAAQVDLAFDGAGHVLVDDVADQRGGLLDADAHRARRSSRGRLARPCRGSAASGRRSRSRG